MTTTTARSLREKKRPIVTLRPGWVAVATSIALAIVVAFLLSAAMRARSTVSYVTYPVLR